MDFSEAPLSQELKAAAWTGYHEDLKERWASALALDKEIIETLLAAGKSAEDIKAFFQALPRTAVHADARALGKLITAAAQKLGHINQAKQTGLVLQDGCLFTVSKRGDPQKVANFTVRAKAMLPQGYAVELVRDDGHTVTLALTTKALSGRGLFRVALPAGFVFSGSDADLARLHEFIVSQKPPMQSMKGDDELTITSSLPELFESDELRTWARELLEGQRSPADIRDLTPLVETLIGLRLAKHLKEDLALPSWPALAAQLLAITSARRVPPALTKLIPVIDALLADGKLEYRRIGQTIEFSKTQLEEELLHNTDFSKYQISSALNNVGKAYRARRVIGGKKVTTRSISLDKLADFGLSITAL